MRVSRFVLAVFLVFVFSLSLGSQQLTSPQRDAGAVAVVEQAVGALGGQTFLGSIVDSVSTGEIVANSDDSTQNSAFTWKTKSGEFRYEVQAQNGSSKVFVSGHGHPANSENGNTSALPQFTALATPAFHLPGIVLFSRLLDPQFAITAMGTSGLANGQLGVHIRVRSSLQSASAAVTQQDWYIDQSTGLPFRVEYCLPSVDRSDDCAPSTIEYSDYHSVSAIAVPFTLKFSLPDGSANLAKVSSTSFNVGLSAADFDLLTRSAQ